MVNKTLKSCRKRWEEELSGEVWVVMECDVKSTKGDLLRLYRGKRNGAKSDEKKLRSQLAFTKGQQNSVGRRTSSQKTPLGERGK